MAVTQVGYTATAVATSSVMPVVVAVAAFPPILKLAAVPVILVPIRADGVPNAGVTRVGEVDNTTLPVPVDVVTPVPPLATGNVPEYAVAVTAPQVGVPAPADINTCPEVPAAV